MQAVLNILRRVWQAIKEFWQNIERRDRVRFIVISSVALTGIIVVLFMITRTDYAELYSQLDDAELAEVRDILSSSGVSYRVEGNSILVPESQLRQQQLTLANMGYPKTGVSYEWLDRISGFGTSDFEKRMWANINARANLQSILMVNPLIQHANVIIDQPDNSASLYRSEVVPVTASVQLTLLDTLSPEQINGVIMLVSNGYPDLLPENVIVTDQYMNILSDRPPTVIDIQAGREEIRSHLQRRLERDIYSLLVPALGADRVRAVVGVTLDWDQKSSESITFSPVVGEDGIIVSLQETIEKATGGRTGGQPGIDENGGDEPLYPEAGDLGDSWESLIRTINYEVNQIVERIERESGIVSNMTASITIDSNELAADLNNARVIQEIVAGVLGLERSEYNRITVAFLPFNGTQAERDARAQLQAEQDAADFRAFITTIALYVILGICLIILLWRVIKLFHKGPSEEELLEMQRAAEMEDLDEYADLLKLASEAPELEETKTPERLKIEDFVDRNPEMVASLLRNWFNEDPIRRR